MKRAFVLITIGALLVLNSCFGGSSRHITYVSYDERDIDCIHDNLEQVENLLEDIMSDMDNHCYDSRIDDAINKIRNTKDDLYETLIEDDGYYEPHGRY